MCGECRNILHLGHRSSLIHSMNEPHSWKECTQYFPRKYSIHPWEVLSSSLACIRFIPGLDSDVFFQVQAMGDA